MTYFNRNVARVMLTAAQMGCVDVGDVCGRSRPRSLVSIRRAIVFVSRHCLPVQPSYPEIAKVIRATGSSHTGVLQAYRSFFKDPEAQKIARETATAMGVLEKYLKAAYLAEKELQR